MESMAAGGLGGAVPPKAVSNLGLIVSQTSPGCNISTVIP